MWQMPNLIVAFNLMIGHSCPLTMTTIYIYIHIYTSVSPLNLDQTLLNFVADRDEYHNVA